MMFINDVDVSLDQSSVYGQYTRDLTWSKATLQQFDDVLVRLNIVLYSRQIMDDRQQTADFRFQVPSFEEADDLHLVRQGPAYIMNRAPIRQETLFCLAGVSNVITHHPLSRQGECRQVTLSQNTALGQSLLQETSVTSTADGHELLAAGQGTQLIVSDQVQDNWHLGNLLHRLMGVLPSIVDYGHPQDLARLEQKTGKLDDARRHYREFLDHWGDADMPVPIVERAREQLASLAN